MNPALLNLQSIELYLSITHTFSRLCQKFTYNAILPIVIIISLHPQIIYNKATIYRILVSCPRKHPQVLQAGGYYNYSITASLFISRVLSSSFTSLAARETSHSPRAFPKRAACEAMWRSTARMSNGRR